MWLSIYLASVIVVGFLIGCLYFHEEENDKMEAYLGLSAGAILWPLLIILFPIVMVVIKMQDNREQALKNIVDASQIKHWDNDIRNLAAIPTDDLKQLLKGIRRGLVEGISAQHVNLIKQELLNRATENGLLK